jgi:anti-sigma regulatory factor (Ser/Thr protein kinase)
MGELPSAAARDAPYEFVHRCWPAHPRQLAPLRAEVRRWSTPIALTGDVEHDFVLAVSQAASNSIEHAYTPPTTDDTVGLIFWTESCALCVEVVGHGLWRTPPVQPTGRGRGIELMQRLIASVSIHHDNHGTRVLLRHPLPDGFSLQAASRVARVVPLRP